MKDSKSKIIVMARDADGHDTKVSYETKECRPFRGSDRQCIEKQIKQKLLPIEDVILFTVRTNVSGEKSNWKCKSISELNNTLSEVFG